MELLAACGSVIKVEKNKLACPILLNTLGFAPDILRVMEKWLTCPCDSPTLSPLPGSTNLQSLKPGKKQCACTEPEVKGLRPHTLLCSFISFTHPFYHCSKTHALMPMLCHDLCPVMEMQRKSC